MSRRRTGGASHKAVTKPTRTDERERSKDIWAPLIAWTEKENEFEYCLVDQAKNQESTGSMRAGHVGLETQVLASGLLLQCWQVWQVDVGAPIRSVYKMSGYRFEISCRWFDSLWNKLSIHNTLGKTRSNGVFIEIWQRPRQPCTILLHWPANKIPCPWYDKERFLPQLCLVSSIVLRRTGTNMDE